MIITGIQSPINSEKETGDLRVIYYNVYGYGKLDGIPDRIKTQAEMIFSLFCPALTVCP